MEEDVVGVVVVRVVMGGFDGGYGVTQLKDTIATALFRAPSGILQSELPKVFLL